MGPLHDDGRMPCMHVATRRVPYAHAQQLHAGRHHTACMRFLRAEREACSYRRDNCMYDYGS